MNPPTLKLIALENLRIDLINPRHPPHASQREALKAIADGKNGSKLFKLAEDIAARGLNPSEFPMVTETEELGVYTVLEGNRRIAALKLATSPQLLESIGVVKNLEKRFKNLANSTDQPFPDQIMCAVLEQNPKRMNY